jgi:two-component system response regulator FixJ
MNQISAEEPSSPSDPVAAPATGVGPGMVHVVDDDEAVRRSLAMLLTSCGLSAETHVSAEALLEQLPALSPGVLIVDIRMPGMSGLELQECLIRQGCTLPVIIVTGHADVGLAVRAMKAGAVDFIEKPYSDSDLLRSVNTGFSRMANTRPAQVAAEQARQRIQTLTPRERETLAGLVDGLPNKRIAHELGISPRTVEIHRANLMEKLGSRNLAEVVRCAIAAGFDRESTR